MLLNPSAICKLKHPLIERNYNMETEAQRKANAKYRRENTKVVAVRFYPSEMDVFKFLDQQGGRASYIKAVLREKMEEAKEK